MRLLLALFIMSSVFSYAQGPTKELKLEVKTYSENEWSKWYFGHQDMRVKKEGDYNKWSMGMYGIDMVITTTEEDSWGSWTMVGTKTVCKIVKKKKYNNWVINYMYGDTAKSMNITALEKDLSSWKIGDNITAKTNADGDWDHWIVEGQLMSSGVMEITMFSVFIPIFSAVIRKEYKLK